MSKSFRSTNEIIEFSSKFIDESVKIESFSRSGTPPEIVYKDNSGDLDEKLIEIIEDYRRRVSIYCSFMSKFKRSKRIVWKNKG